MGDSTMVVESSSADDAAATMTAAGNNNIHEGSEIGMVGSNSGEEDKGRVDEGERSFGGNRWPRQETLALLKIRSDMDAVFRDSSLKGPLWEEVSRKLADLGYHRSAKKCKEKFENVYKYHKRTKDGRGRTGKGKADGKTYRFFDQLEAFENLHSLQIQSLSPPKPQTPTPTSTSATAMPWTTTSTSAHSNFHVFPSSTTNPTITNNNVPAVPPQPIVTTTTTHNSLNPTNIISTQAVPLHSINPYSNNLPSSFHNISSNLFSTSTSSSTASDDHSNQQGSSKKKRKWKEFFRRLTKEVIEKQEELQNRFLKTIEKCEQERLAREEAWRIQEMARINREHEILVQERSTAAAKDAAVIAFLQKVSGGQQQPITVQVQQQENSHPAAAPPPVPATQPTAPLTLPRPLPQPPQPQPLTQASNFETSKMSNGGSDNNNYNNVVSSSSSRWPKGEVQALIKLRTSLDIKYQENGPKGPLWEEISAGMRKLGYNRNAKRCKEKWENINKYFKKVKESNKKRPEDCKTCPYFHQLDAIYKEKISKNDGASGYGVNQPRDSTMVPLMVRPEQQWPPQQEIGRQQQEVAATAMMVESERENVDQIQEDEEDGDSEEEYDGNDFELVANKSAPIGSSE